MNSWRLLIASGLHLLFAVSFLYVVGPTIRLAEQPSSGGYQAHTNELISEVLFMVIAYLLGWVLWYVIMTQTDQKVLDAGHSHESLGLRDAQMKALYYRTSEEGSTTIEQAAKLVGDNRRAEELLEVMVLEDKLVYDEKLRHFVPR